VEFHARPEKVPTQKDLNVADLEPPDSRTRELTKWEELGRAFVSQYNLRTPLLIGYGNRNLPDGHDPWGEDCHVAAVGYIAPGGASVLGAGKPLNEDRWYTLGGADNGGFSFRGITSDYMSIILAITHHDIIIGDFLIPPGTENYFRWIGFLREIQTGGASKR
jgi:hypothetical protein